MSTASFWKLTPVEFDRIGRGFHRARVQQWRNTRFLATTLINLNRDPKSPAYALEEVLPLPGDPRPEPVVVATPEETAAQLRLLDELDKDLL